jgi:hypothetical protein
LVISLSLWEGIKREHERLRKRCDEGIQHSAAEFDRGAHKLGTLFLWTVKTMKARTWKKQDAWGINDQLTSIWPGDLQHPFLERMKMTGMFAYLTGRASA